MVRIPVSYNDAPVMLKEVHSGHIGCFRCGDARRRPSPHPSPDRMRRLRRTASLGGRRARRLRARWACRPRRPRRVGRSHDYLRDQCPAADQKADFLRWLADTTGDADVFFVPDEDT